jgi:hypothetical protein
MNANIIFERYEKDISFVVDCEMHGCISSDEFKVTDIANDLRYLTHSKDLKDEFAIFLFDKMFKEIRINYFLYRLQDLAASSTSEVVVKHMFNKLIACPNIRTDSVLEVIMANQYLPKLYKVML